MNLNQAAKSNQRLRCDTHDQEQLQSYQQENLHNDEQTHAIRFYSI